jgi:hypothetical protein
VEAVVDVAVTTVKPNDEFLESQEFRILQAKFSTGARLRELNSIAIVLATLAQVRPPGREEKRHFPKLIEWYKCSWPDITPWLPFVTLRDALDIPIDGNRELAEFRLKKCVEGSP